MSVSGDTPLPLVEQKILNRLRSDLDESTEYWKVFVGNYLNQLAARIRRLRSALTTGDLDEAMDAALSLKHPAK